MTVQATYLPGDGTDTKPLTHIEAASGGAKIYVFGDAYDRKQDRMVKAALMSSGLDSRSIVEAGSASTAGVLSAIAELRAAVLAGDAGFVEIDLDQLLQTDDDPEWTALIAHNWDD